MNGGADLGGMMGFGPVVQEENEPLFHAPWEARVLGMVVALGACGKWNLDMSRYARETMPTAEYLRADYYSIWLDAAVRLLKERGMISDGELETAKALIPPVEVARKLEAKDVAAVLNAGGPANRPEEGTPVFAVGDMVQTINDHPVTHTRMARYARGKSGKIVKVHGFHVFPDSSAHGEGENPQWLYKVTFSAQELWGRQSNPHDTVSLDLWEPYLRATQ